MVGRTKQIVTSMSAPVGGLNVRDAINNMPTGDAIELINWIPEQYGVRTRKGYQEWCTGMTDPIRTIMQYQPNREDVASYRLFASTDSNIYNVTDSSAAPPVSLALTPTANGGKWSSTMFTNTAGAFLLAVTEIGGYKHYNGTVWTTPTFGVGAGQVGGIDPSNVVFITSWKKRVWFIEKNSTTAWYGPTDGITGTFTPVYLGSFAKRGGKLIFISNWTIDAGEGIDDFLVFGFENGDVLVYKGTDPGVAASFSLVGAWYVGNLVGGRRCFCALGGDLLIMSELGLQPMSFVTRGGQSALRVSSTDYLGKIQPRLADLAATYATQTTWDLVLFPRDNLFIITIPSVTGQFEQYVLYTNTNTWTLFSGIPMLCSEVANNQFFFGTETGKVYKGFTGFFDDVPRLGTTGLSIVGRIQPSFSYFGMPGRNKQFHMVRPTFLSADVPAISCQMLADYKIQTPITPVSSGIAAGSLWDSSLWDTATWGGELSTYDDWYGVESIGYTGSVLIRTSTVGDTFLASIDIMLEPAGPM